MLRQRVVTAVLLLPLALGVILFAPRWLFDIVVGIALLLLSLEFSALCGLRTPGRVAYAGIVIALFAGAVGPWQYATVGGRVLLGAAVLFWLLAPLWLATRTVFPNAMKLVLGLPMLGGAGFALHALKLLDDYGLWLLLAFVVVWAADIGAYAAGRTWGRRKLAPAISPGKTWEGFAGGVAAVLAAGATAAAASSDKTPWVAWIALLALLTVFSVIGDLLESLLKRQAGVKDSGQLLPGHGGLLDRLDSLLAVAPVFLFAGTKIGIFGELSSFGP